MRALFWHLKLLHALLPDGAVGAGCRRCVFFFILVLKSKKLLCDHV